MSGFEIKMPKLGESITEGTIVSWSVQVGDVIREDDVLFEVNTAKVSAEVRGGLWLIWAEMMSLPSFLPVRKKA